MKDLTEQYRKSLWRLMNIFKPYLTETNLIEANKRLTEWLIFYNFNRPHQALDYLTPFSVLSVTS